EGAMAAEVSQIQAPVRGLGQRNSLAIGVHGLPHQIDQSRITEHVAMITAAADRLTQRLGGRSRPS
ncbi:MAG: hypothetical protein ACXVIH_15150, partial [Ilumatobacteraceae bacterium]